MIRRAVLEMTREKEIRLDILEGVIAVLQNDIEAESAIQNLATQLDLDGQLLINMIDLQSSTTKRFPTILIDLFKQQDQNDETKLCQSFLGLINGDLSCVKLISKKLGIDQAKTLPILAAALGDMGVLSESYTFFKEKLGISNEKAVRIILQLCHGHTECINALANMSTEQFQINDPELVKSLLKITFVSRQIKDFWLTTHVKQLISGIDYDIKKISEKLVK